MSFIHLHTHTEYSILDSLIKTKQLVAKAKEYGQEAVALTDHGSMYGVFEFWKECHEQELKPLLGCEVNVAAKSRMDRNPTEKSSSIVLLAKNMAGYKNILQLVSLGHLEGFYYKPRVDKEILAKYHENLIVLSGHEYSEIRQHYILGDNDKAEQAAKWYKDIFGEDFYIELVRVGIDHEDELNEKLITLARKLDIPIVATGDVHYLAEEDYSAREIVWAISDGKKLTDPSRRQDKNHQFYMKSPDAMVELWKDLPEAIENTKNIADKIEDFKITYGIVQPKFNKIPDEDDRGALVRKLAYEGAEKLYGEITPKLHDRLEYELEILHEKGFDEYLLVVQDYANEARRRGIVISARGSVVGSVAVYCLGITNTDPMMWNLPFERFLNKERNSFPDIDMDFQDDRRNEMFDYVREIYGKECCSNVITFGKLTTKAAIRDVGRVMGIPLSTCDRLSKMVTVKFGRVTKAKEMMDPEKYPEFAELVNSSEDLQLLIKNVMKIEGLTRNIGMHACGFLITPRPIYEYIPVCFEKEGRQMMTQIVGSKLEDLGLMKFDFLGVTNLSAVGKTLEYIKKYRGFDLDLQKVPTDDKKTFERIFQIADTNAVFQLESGGMKKYLKELKPTTIRDIAALIALYRPGPMMNIPMYIENKNGMKKIQYLVPECKDILEESYGVLVYQDQALLLAIKAAGYSWGEADVLRKAMGKKIPELMAEQEKKFKNGVMAKGYSQETAEQLFELVKPFADYGFNKAHTAAYATLSYWTAYLKANYTQEFIAALMQGDIEKPDKLTRDILEAQHHGIEVMPPDVNQSLEDFSIEQSVDENGQGGKIRFGLGGLKSVGRAQVEEIVHARGDNPYTSLEDLLSRVDLKKVTKNAIDVLIKVGAMDAFGKRSQLLEIYLKAYESAQKLSKSSQTATLSMFGEEEIKSLDPMKLPDIAELTPAQKVDYEKEYMGVYFSTHPLARIKSSLERKNIKTLHDLKKNARVGDKIKIAAVIKTLRCVFTKKDNKKMCFGIIEDPDNAINFALFPTTYEKYESIIAEGKTYIIEGKKNFRDEQHGILVDSMKLLEFDKYEEDQGLDDNPKTSAPVQAPTRINSVSESTELVIPDSIRQGPTSVGNLQETITPLAEPTPTTQVAKVYYDAVPQVAMQAPTPQPVVEKIYTNIQITLPATTDMAVLKQLNQMFMSKPGDAEITLVLKDDYGNEKKMVLNTKFQVTEHSAQEIKNIVSSAQVSMY